MHPSHRIAIATAALVLLAVLPVAAAFQEPMTWEAPPRKAREPNPLGPSRTNLQRGKELYTANCVVCHGDGAKGDGPAAAALQPRPRDLTATDVRDHSDGALFWKISEGRAPMPGFKSALPDDDRWRVVLHLRSLGLRARWKVPFDRVMATYERLAAELQAAPAARLADSADGLASWIAEVPLPEALRKDAGAVKTWEQAVAGLQKACADLAAAAKEPLDRADAFDRLSRALLAWASAYPLPGELTLYAFEQDGHKTHGPWLWLQSAESPTSPYQAPAADGAKPRPGAVLGPRKESAGAKRDQ